VVDSTLLCPISAIALQSANSTEDTLELTYHLIDYLGTQKEGVLTFNVSNMVLAAHSNASYLSETNAQSGTGGHFFLSSNSAIPQNNGAILNIEQIVGGAAETLFFIAARHLKTLQSLPSGHWPSWWRLRSRRQN